MSISISDKRTRDVAIPFEATTYSTTALGTDGGLDKGKIISSDLIVPVRFSTPDRGALTEAHLSMNLTVGSPLTVKVAIGRFNANGVDAVSSYTNAEIDDSHKKIFGTDNPVASSGSTLFIDGINIFPLLPKRGSANFNADGFVLVFKFSRARADADVLKSLAAYCSAQMGLV